MFCKFTCHDGYCIYLATQYISAIKQEENGCSSIFSIGGQDVMVCGNAEDILKTVLGVINKYQKESIASSFDMMSELGKKLAKDAENSAPGEEWKQIYDDDDDDDEKEKEKEEDGF